MDSRNAAMDGLPDFRQCGWRHPVSVSQAVPETRPSRPIAAMQDAIHVARHPVRELRISCRCPDNREAPSSSTSWNVCSQLCEVQAVRSGAPLPLGAHMRGNGVNFAIFSRHATGVRLDLFDRAEDTAPARSIILDAARNKTGDIWHVWLEGIRPGQLYGFRIAGPYAPHDGHRFNPNKLVLDPCATAIVPPADRDSRFAVGYDPSSPQKDLSFSDVDNAGSAPKCVITYEDFDWHGDQPLRLPWTSTVIYELHVRGYTIDPSAGVQSPGTYRGLIEKIPYLKDLGVTAVELMPVQEFNEHDSLRINPKTGERLRNFWGYDPVSFFAPKASYASVRERRRTGPGIQGDGPRVSSRGARSDPGRRLQPHRRRRRAGTDALVPRHRQRDLLLARRRQALLPELHRHGTNRQREPSRRARSHPRRAALLGDGDARRRLPLRSRLGARPRRPRPCAGRCAAPRAHRRGSDPPRRQAHCRSLGCRGRLSGRVRSPSAAGRNGTAISATTCGGSGEGTRA